MSLFSCPRLYVLKQAWNSTRQALGQAFLFIRIGIAFFGPTYGMHISPDFFPARLGGDHRHRRHVVAIIGGGFRLILPAVVVYLFTLYFALGGKPRIANGFRPRSFGFIPCLQSFMSELPAGHRGSRLFFFFLLSAAAITSMVALLEIPVAAITHRRRVLRWKTTATVGTAVFILGVPSALSYGVLGEVRIWSLGILDAIDHAVSNFLLPAIGILTALYVGWRLERGVALSESDFGDTAIGRLWLWLIRLLVPLSILGILLQSTGAL